MARKAPLRDQIVKLLVGAGQASPSPPVGPALGSKGVKSMDFCKEFNARSAHFIAGTPIPCLVTIRPDRTFHFRMRTPPTATLLLAAAGVESVKNKIRGAGNTAGPKALAKVVNSQTSSVLISSSSSTDEMKDSKAEDEEDAKDVGDNKDVRSRFTVNVTGKPAAKDLKGNAKLGVVGTVSLKHVYEIAKIKATEERLKGLTLEGIARSVIAQAGSMGVAVVP